MEFSIANIRAVIRITYPRRQAMLVTIVFCLSAAHAQVNTWTNFGSGRWQDPFWSLGVLPGFGQSILITNGSSKTVTISAATAQDFPQSLSIDSLILQSPDVSSNTLLLDDVGFDVPLTARSIVISTNCAITLVSSSLNITGPSGVGMSVGGTLAQDAASVVAGGQMDVGFIGRGVYHLNDGFLTVTQVFLSGLDQTNTVFVQDGGVNAAGIVHLQSGTYLLNDGQYDTTTYFTGGTLVQHGGTLLRGTEGGDADYFLTGGTNFAGVTAGTAVQTGGLLHGHVSVLDGSYTLSNGVVDVGAMSLDGRAYFAQYGGTVRISGAISTSGHGFGRGTSWDWFHGAYWLGGGTLSCAEMNMPDGSYFQAGGTNIVTGSITVAPYGAGPAPCPFHVAGGTLIASNITIGPAGAYGGLIQSGGQIFVSNLTIGSPSPQNLPGQFLQTGGTIHQSGVFTLNASSSVTVAPGDQEFGLLQSGWGSLTFASNAPTIIHLAGISNLSLVINNWSGSFAGGGTHQILLRNASTPIPQSLVSGLRFHNPAGVPADIYQARILSTGEVVPIAFPTAPWLSPYPGGRLWLSLRTDRTLRLDFQGTAGSNYLIQSSSNLLDWAAYTNVGPPDSVLTVPNVWATNALPLFYRANLIQ